MKWRKLGRVFVAQAQQDWMSTHAAWPRALHMGDDRFRVFFSTRDLQGRSHIACLDLDLKTPARVLSVSPQPVLAPGPPGAFDDRGVIPSSLIRLAGRTALYYGGLTETSGASFECFCGLSLLDDDLATATRVSATPLLERNAAEPYSGGAVCVSSRRPEAGFHMWYESCVGWPSEGPRATPRYAIKYATSEDGLRWNRFDEVSIGDSECRPYVSNPSVLIEGNLFRMWYSYKLEGRYRIGYAESHDGRAWNREDERGGLGPSESGWDSEDVEYPFVFPHGGDLYMLYNGNHYGKTGFGLARLERE